MSKLLLAWLCLALINSVLAIKCYTCNPDQQPNCSESTSSVQCEVKNWFAVYCIKIVAEEDGVERVAKGCLYFEGPNRTCEVMAPNFITGNFSKVNCYRCSTKLCNSASRFAGFNFMLIGLLPFILLYY